MALEVAEVVRAKHRAAHPPAFKELIRAFLLAKTDGDSIRALFKVLVPHPIIILARPSASYRVSLPC